MHREAAALAAALTLVGCDALTSERADEAPPLVVGRGALDEVLLLTGEVDAAESIPLNVPRTEDWNVQIRWLADDGTLVQAGDRVVEFDNAAVVDRILEADLAVVEAGIALAEQRAKDDVAAADKRFEVQTQTIAVKKARLDADSPPELFSRRQAQTHALELSRAEVALATAKSDLAATLEAAQHEQQTKVIAYDKAMRALAAAEAQLHNLEVTAPSPGIVVIADHPWEGRKFQVSDNVWAGMTIAKLPDLTKLVVAAKLSDVDDGRVQPGMPATCIVDAFADTPLPGFVAAVTSVAQDTGRHSTRRFFSVKVELTSTQRAVLRPGLSVQVQVTTRHVDDGVLAPRAGLDLRDESVRARLSDGREVDVVVDFCDVTTCVVSEGLAEGDVLLPIGAAS